MSIKRYEVNVDGNHFEFSEGKYVLYEDYVKEIKRYRATLEEVGGCSDICLGCKIQIRCTLDNKHLSDYIKSNPS